MCQTLSHYEEVAKKPPAASDVGIGSAGVIGAPRIWRRVLVSGLLWEAILRLLLSAFIYTNSFNPLGVLGLFSFTQGKQRSPENLEIWVRIQTLLRIFQEVSSIANEWYIIINVLVVKCALLSCVFGYVVPIRRDCLGEMVNQRHGWWESVIWGRPLKHLACPDAQLYLCFLIF